MHTHASGHALTVWRVPTPSSREGARRVLVADGDHEAASALCLALEDEGFATRAVHTGLDAVMQVHKWRPGAVLLDLTMPLGDGWEAIDAIREFDSAMLLLAQARRMSRVDEMRAQRNGFDGYFVKPTPFDGVIDLIAHYFAKRPVR